MAKAESLRIAVTGGKTGGHVFPALAVIQALRRYGAEGHSEKAATPPTPTTEVLYIGIKGGIEERVVPTAGITLETLGLTTPDSPTRGARFLLELPIRTAQTYRLLQQFRPQALFSTGGFVSLPPTIAALIRRIPIVIFLPDVTAGRTVRLVSRFAAHVALVDDRARSLLAGSKQTTVTGYPVREGFTSLTRDAARQRLGLTENDRLMLVMGGSLGARSINRAVSHHLPDLLEVTRLFQIVGPANVDAAVRAEANLPSHLRARYTAVPSLDAGEIATVMLAADLAVTRAGASILGELPAAGLPAIIVPLPARRVNQLENAETLCAAGGCLVVADGDLDRQLLPLVSQLMEDAGKRSQMAAAMRAQLKPEAARDVARLIIGTAGCTT